MERVTRVRCWRLAALAAWLCLAGIGGVGTAARRSGDKGPEPGPEIQLSNSEFKALDTFEGHTLTKADKVFAAKDYKRAAAEYDSFILEFPKSKAIPYALLRKARCLHLAGKRYEAIKEYQEVLDYFPNAVKYAAAALFHIGQCHWENGDEEQAMKVWAKMAEDADYSKHPLAAAAISRLADHIARQGQPERAVAYHRQVACNFRRTNPKAAKYALDQVVHFYVRTQPNEAKLRAFYRDVRGFADRPQKLGADIESSRRYWGTVCGLVRIHGRFDSAQSELRRRYYQYWAGVLRGRFPEWDYYQLTVADLQRAADGDTAKWMKALDQQFERYQKPGNYARIVRWIALFARHKAKAMEYYDKLRFEKMTNGQIREAMRIFYERVRDEKMGRNLFAKLRLDEMPDTEKTSLERYFWGRDPEVVRDVCASFDDKELGQMELLRFYHWRKDAKNGVPLADQLVNVPRFAAEALWLKAQILHATKQYAKAIAAYQQCDNPPGNIWGIADCYARLGKVEKAVGQLREIENFFKDHAPEAALRIARIYREAGMKPQQIAALRNVLKKYPESRQSSNAHQELERMGIKMGGGLDAQ